MQFLFDFLQRLQRPSPALITHLIFTRRHAEQATVAELILIVAVRSPVYLLAVAGWFRWRLQLDISC